MAIPKFLDDLNIIAKLGDYPGSDNNLSTAQFKAKFDEASIKIQNYINNTFLPYMNQLVDVDALLKGIIDKTLTEEDKAAGAKATGDALKKKLDMAGGTMTGDINMSNHRISNVADPVQESDVTNKAYVDYLHKFFTVTLPASGWSSSVPHWQTVIREDILESDNPHWSFYLVPTSQEEWYAHKEAFDCVDALYTEDGKLHFVCGEYKPEIDLTIQLEVNR